MAKKKAKREKKAKKDKKHAKTNEVPVRNLINGLRQAAELQLTIANLLEELPKKVLTTELPVARKALTFRSIAIGNSCECGR